MSRKDKNIIIVELVIIAVILPIAIMGWVKFFRLANEFIEYENKINNNIISYNDPILIEKIQENKESKEAKKELIVTDDVSKIFSEIKKDNYVIVTFAQSTCSACSRFKPSAIEYAKESIYDYYWIDIDLLEEDDFNKIVNKYSNLKYTPYTVLMKKNKIIWENEGAININSLKTQIEDLTK